MVNDTHTLSQIHILTQKHAVNVYGTNDNKHRYHKYMHTYRHLYNYSQTYSLINLAPSTSFDTLADF